MKIIIVLSAALLFGAAVHAQKRVLVTPDGDARILSGRMSAAEAVRADAARSLAAVCSDKGTFGYSRSAYPGANVQFEAFHKDIVAMWYLAPASGTIDSVFVYNLDVGTLDSTVTVRLFNSNIHPGSGPGYGYPKPGKLCWGYYISTNDLDNGLAAFPEDATDTTWHSTVPGALPSFSPMGSEIWGFGGYPKVMGAFTTNAIAMSDLGTVSVDEGQPFFITIRMYGPHVAQEDDHRTGYLAQAETDSLQTHNWKFYEHIYQGPGFTCPGWVARGDFNFLIWYSMTVTTNLPPAISGMTRVENTFSTADQAIQAVIVDCDASNPLTAGVEEAMLRYTLNGVQQPDLPLTYLGSDVWEGAIPGGSVGDLVAYRIVSSDSTGAADSTATVEYRIVGLSNGWYAADTGAACVERDIRSSGATVAPASLFLPQFAGSGEAPLDDGTAGPFDMGGRFTVFGDTFRYAWVGVNGGLALSKSASDTLDVNANGFATRLWDFPYAQKEGRGSAADAELMPGMFIAPFWSDLIVGDSSAAYGRIVTGDAGDSCLFVVEWDSLGSFDQGEPTADATTFRAVLDRCTGAIEFQYAHVGSLGLDSAALVGMQADSNGVSGPDPGWVYLNRDGAPDQTIPRNGWCVRFHPVVGTVAVDGWNMVAVSLAPLDGDYSMEALFPGSAVPGAVSPAYGYSSGYVPAESLAHGRGYWIKFGSTGAAGVSAGELVHDVTAPVQDKWNMVGGPAGFLPTSAIVPGGVTVASSYFGYGEAGYEAASALRGGKGYWVKVNGAGTLHMTASASVPGAAASATPAASGLNMLRFRDATGRTATLGLASAGAGAGASLASELPPPPPAGAFDVRFASQRTIETYTGAGIDIPVVASGLRWPVTMEWEIPDPPPAGHFTFSWDEGSQRNVREIAGSGSIVMHAASGGAAARFVVGSGTPSGIPSEFRLGPNYPNPFNPLTRLVADLPRDGDLSVVIYDMLGRTVGILASGMHRAGSHVLEWNGVDQDGAPSPTGVYIVRMRAGDFQAARKILLMK